MAIIDLIAHWTDRSEAVEGQHTDSEGKPFEKSYSKRIMRTKEVHLCAIFLVIYVGKRLINSVYNSFITSFRLSGVEVTTGGMTIAQRNVFMR